MHPHYLILPPLLLGHPALAAPPIIPDSLTKVCKAFVQGASDFSPLKQAWNTSGVAKTLGHNALKPKINAVWTTRNRTVMGLIPSLKLKGWVAKVEKLYSDDFFGLAPERFIVIEGNFDCGLPIAFSAQKIAASSSMAAKVAKIAVRDVVVLDATVIPSTKSAGEWEGVGILWDAFGGLWGNRAFNHPEFNIKINNITGP